MGAFGKSSSGSRANGSNMPPLVASHAGLLADETVNIGERQQGRTSRRLTKVLQAYCHPHARTRRNSCMRVRERVSVGHCGRYIPNR
jgi:hypothetical protein